MPDLYIGNNLAKCLCQTKTGAQDRRYTDTARQALSNHRAHRSLDGKGLQGQGYRSFVSQQSPNFLYKAVKLWWLRVFIAQRCHLVSHNRVRGYVDARKVQYFFPFRLGDAGHRETGPSTALYTCFCHCSSPGSIYYILFFRNTSFLDIVAELAIRSRIYAILAPWL